MILFLQLVVGLVLLAGDRAYAKIGYFWHITDIHYDALYSMNGDTRKGCWRNHNEGGGRSGARPTSRFGDYHCDSPWDLIESAVQEMRARQGDNVEFVLWTGDALSHTVKNFPQKYQLELLSNVTDLLKRTFSSQFVFPALGHDDPAIRSAVRELWRLWLPSDSLHTFEKGGYYLIEQKMKKLQIVVLNTNLMTGATRQQNLSVKTDLEEEARRQWEWLDGVLAKCLNNKENVYLVGHHPPGVDERQKGALPHRHTSYTDHHNKRYLRLVRKYSDIIVGQFFGHLHSDTFRLVYNEKGRPVSWAMVAPSVTPRRTSDGPNNPGLRLYKFDSDTGQVHDYTQYFLDLSNKNSATEAEWLPEYILTSHYGLSNVTPLSLHNLADKFTQVSVAENTAFSRYYTANTVQMNTGPVANGCDQSCVHSHYCAITRIDYSDYQYCLKTVPSPLSSSAVTTTSKLTLTVTLTLIMAVASAGPLFSVLLR